jgi:hypothetical protein
VIIAGLVNQLLCELIAESLKKQLKAKVNILAPTIPRSGIEGVAVDKKADVVIVGLADSEVPTICKRLLRRLPEAVVVGVVSDSSGKVGQKTRVIRTLLSDDMSLNQIGDTILAAMQKLISNTEREDQTH